MNISVVGAGYVGLVCGAGFAEMGNSVVCVDSDGEKIQKLRNGIVPIYEPGLEEVIRDNAAGGGLSFTTDIVEALRETDICFIAVGTPMGEAGDADVSHVLAVARDIGKHMDKRMLVVNKSTVPVGTGDKVRARVAEQLAARGSDLAFDVVSNPEFLKEGRALADFMSPDRVVVGADNDRPLKIMYELYAPFIRNHDRFIAMDIRSSEMTKYAANAMLACKISFMSEISNICERVGADVNRVRIGIGSDRRIGYHFIYPGCGYGGSCFPKDMQALIRTSMDSGHEPLMLRSIETVNREQKRLMAEKVLARFGGTVKGKVFAIWGLAFKPGTDDMREAPSLTVINRLSECGALVRAYDPRAVRRAREFHFRGNPSIEYFSDKYDAVRSVDAMLLLTEWKEFRSPDFTKMRKLMRQPVIFDGRNQYDGERMAEMGFECHQIGVGTERAKTR